VNPSSETETCSRGRSALDRGGVSRERGRPTLERDGTSPEGATDPRARRICTGAGRRRTPRAERSGVPPGGGWADCLTGLGFLGLFCACVSVRLRLFFTSLSGFPLVG
jgi:hypothetical protein